MNLVLFYAPTTCALVPYVTLTEAGAEFEVSKIDLRKGQQNLPGYLRLNPKHKVPTLLIDGEPLTENVAIQIWIARSFPHARLLPAAPAQEIRAISFLAWCASGIHPSITPNVFPQRFCDIPGSEDGVRRCASKTLADNYRIADEMLAGKEWFFDEFTAADAYFFWCFRRGIQAPVDVSAFANAQAHFERVKARPSVQKVLAFEAQVLEEFQRAG